MVQILVVLWVLTASGAFAQEVKSPTLSETLEWMKSSLAPKGILGLDSNGYNKYEAVPGKTSYTEVIKSFSYDGCRVKVVKETETINPLVGDYKAQYTDEFNLSDFDPSAVETHSGDGDLKGHIVLFHTTNDKKLIHCSSISLNGAEAGKSTPCIPALDDTEGLRFATKEYTERFAKALRHGIKLCDGRPSTF